jgi:integrase
MKIRCKEFKYVQAWVDSEGRPHCYFRRPGFKRVRLPSPIGSAEFQAAYRQAMDQTAEPIGAKANKSGSVSASIAAYYVSDAWDTLAAGTQIMRRAILERFRGRTMRNGTRYGELPLAGLHQSFLVEYLRPMKPHARLNTFKAIRGWLKYAQHDITRGMDKPKVKSEKHPSWKPEHLAAYESRHPMGSKARLAYALARYTGAGRSEIARMGPKHVQGGAIAIARQKTGVEASIPIHPALQATLDATPVTGFSTFLVTKAGKPYSPNDLSEQFRSWCDEAGLPGYSLHGLRHTMGDSLAETGSNAFEIGAVLGHASPRSSMHYTQGADRKRMARAAMKKLIDGNGR